MAKILWLRRAKAAIRWRLPKFELMRLMERRELRRYGKLFITSFPKIVLAGKKRSRFNIEIDYRLVGPRVKVVLKKELLGKANPAFGMEKKFKKELDAIARPEIARIMLGFEKRAIVIELMQGGYDLKHKIEADLDRFRKMHGQQWASYLVETIERHAKKSGFRQVKIRDPTTTYWYKNPAIRDEIYNPATNEQTKEKIRKNIKKLYEAVANELHYIKEGDFFIKEL